MAGVARGAGEYRHDAPLDPPAWLHLEEKSLSASEQDAQARAQWRESTAGLDPGRLVFVDETSTTIALTRRRARARKGVRAAGRVPRNWGQPTSLVGALCLGGLRTAGAIEGAFDTPAFVVFVERFLVPTLEPGQVVVMDNLSVHKAGRVRQLIEARGCQVLFLPPYSPDFSPIEPCFSKLKAALRKAAARTQEGLIEAIGQAMSLVTSEDAQGWFQHCGFLARPT